MINLKKILQKRSFTYTLTGLSPQEFRLAEKKFAHALNAQNKKRKRETRLPTAAIQLFFVLFYYTVHPTYNLLEVLFGYRDHAARNRLLRLKPIAEKAIGKPLLLARRRIVNLKSFYAEFSIPKNIFTLGFRRDIKNQRARIAASVPLTHVPAQRPGSKKTLLIATENHKLLATPRISPQKTQELEKEKIITSAASIPEKSQPKQSDITIPAAPPQPPRQETPTAPQEAVETAAKLKDFIQQEVRKQMQYTQPPPPPQPIPKERIPEQPPPPPPPEYSRPLPPQQKPKEAPLQRKAPRIPAQDIYQPPEIPEEEKPEWAQKLEEKIARQKPEKEAPITYARKEEPPAEIKKGEINISEKLAEIKNKINEQLKRPSDELSIIEFVDAIIQEGYYSGASDIHIEPEEKEVVVRLRIDGVLRDVVIYPKIIHSTVITRIKVIAGLRTDEHQAAQDGRFKLPIDRGFMDVRVSIAPTYYGENSVMRILTQQKELSLEEIGLLDNDLEKVQRAAQRPHGMILSCGPTGSGKTTTLYAIIRLLNTRDISIITIEDPIEYSIAGIDQIQVNQKTGLTFASGLRSILRQDPDILMVGEIRDEETARIAVNAALTGHLLLSTIHTNDAPTALPRLIDMGVEPFLVASTVNVVIGQRLVRRICDHCKTPYTLTEENLKDLSKLVTIETLKGYTKFYRGAGCNACGDSGYKGRVGIYEVLEITDNIQALIMSRASSDDIKYVAIKNGMTTMLDDGIKKAVAGHTTIEEVLRVARE